MKIEIKNVGMIKEANLKIDGLTVIAGENDTGKSTVGKILFCIIKAISKYEDFKESKIDKIEDILDEIFFITRRKISDDKEYNRLKDIFSIRKYIQIGEKNPSKYIENIQEKIKKIRLEDNMNNLIFRLLDEIEYIIHIPDEKQKLIENGLNKVFKSEFDSDIVSFNAESGTIKLLENDRLILDIAIVNNKLILQNEVEPIEIKDATFVETPLVLNNHDLLIRSQTGLDLTKRRTRKLGIPYTIFHTKDLFDKLKSRELEFYLDTEFEPQFIKDITNIINGDISYDEDERDFVYIKNDKKINIKNTATGIKGFGIIQLLLNSGFINRKSLLILDEPEIHLHPKWQLKYAQLISVLVRNNIPIVVTSHSPYMIEALKRYSDCENLQDKSNFYLAEEGIIEDKNKLQEIYEKLSQPYDTFDDMDKKSLNE